MEASIKSNDINQNNKRQKTLLFEILILYLS